MPTKHSNDARIDQQYLYQPGTVRTFSSVALTSGILSHLPIPGRASIMMANDALESYVRAAALELEVIRFNVVAQPFVTETVEMMGMETSSGICTKDTARTHLRAIEGDMNGEILSAADYN